MNKGNIALKDANFIERVKSMLKVDFYRMFTTSFFYIMAGICFVMPILILVMTTMVQAPPVGTTYAPEVPSAPMATFTNVWQIIGSVSGASMAMDLTSMCNINMLYFFIAVLVCVFVSEDYKSGYCKNLFCSRAKKSEYVVSKTTVLSVSGALLLICFIIGSLIGGKIANLSFDYGEAGAMGVILCMVSKIFMVGVFVPLFLAVSVAGKSKLWISLMGALFASMLLYTMVPMIAPLNAGIMNVILCFAGGITFSFGLGALSNLILKKTSVLQ